MFLKVKLAVIASAAVLIASQASGGVGTTVSADEAAGRDVRLASCGTLSAVGYATPGYWSRTYHGSCGHTSISYYPQIYVRWSVPPWSNARICVKARGYKWADGTTYWTSLGCGTEGGGYVHWGQKGHQVMSTTAVKGYSLMIPLGTQFLFTD